MLPQDLLNNKIRSNEKTAVSSRRHPNDFCRLVDTKRRPTGGQWRPQVRMEKYIDPFVHVEITNCGLAPRFSRGFPEQGLMGLSVFTAPAKTGASQLRNDNVYGAFEARQCYIFSGVPTGSGTSSFMWAVDVNLM